MTAILRARLATLVVASALGVVAASPADALAIRLIDSNGQIDIVDGGVGDADPTLGSIDYDSSALGSPALTNWTSTSAQVTSCSSNCPSLALSLEGSNLTRGGSLTFMVTETDLTLNSGFWLGQHSLGGFAGGDVTIQAYLDTTNTAFGVEQAIGDMYEFSPTGTSFNAFSQDYFTFLDGASPFSMTTIVTFNHASKNTQSFVTSKAAVSGLSGVSDVPLPAALPLLGVGMAGMGLVARKRRAKAA